MKRRWIIRSFFIALLLLGVIGWAVSGTKMFGFARESSTQQIVCGSHAGSVVIMYANAHGTTVSDSSRLRWEWQTPPDAQWWPTSDNFTLATPHFGFAFAYRDDGISSFGELAIPYWFFIVIFWTMLCFVWRKTRPPVKGRAFPVEAGEADGGTMRA